MQYGFISTSEIENIHLSFWQSLTWSRILVDSGQAQETFYYGDIHSTYVLVEIRSIGLGFFGAFALGVLPSQIGEDWEGFLSALQQVLREKSVLFFQIEPIEESGILNPESQIVQKPYKIFITPYTRVLDLLQTEDEILGGMHEKGRYNIRTAIKRGVRIEKVDITHENIDIWMSLLTDTLSRDGFAGNSRKYYEIFIRSIEQRNQGGLYLARYDGRVIAGGIFVFTPERAIYYYGASSSNPSDRKVFASYLLQWEIIRIAKSQGICIYDFLGISAPTNVDDSLAGVSFFKSRFGGEVVKLPEKIIFPLSWKYRVFMSLQKIKNLLKRR